MDIQTPLSALRWRGFLRSAWPWRSAAYLLTSVPVIGVAGPIFLLLGLPWLFLLAQRHGDRPSLGTAAFLIVLGAALVGGVGPWLALPLGAIERYRLRIVDDRAGAALGPRRPGVGFRPWARYADEATWRALAYALLLVTVGAAVLALLATGLLMIGVLVASPWLVRDSGDPIALGVLAVNDHVGARWAVLAGLVLLVAVPYLVALLAGGHAAVARALLSGRGPEQLRAELVEVTHSRARLADSFAAERRRIERDLHDGAQQRLVSLTLQLGLARLDVPANSPAAIAVARAHDQAKQLMKELRELIHGIYPQTLRDLGLPAALRELADRAPVPVHVDVELPVPPSERVEVAGYFAIAESLTNVARHSGATRAGVVLRQSAGTLTVEVTDDGRGGADPAAGSGLTGLADRVAAVGGRTLLSSPPGGPTRLRLELPCG